jgi:hypothetical protein
MSRGHEVNAVIGVYYFIRCCWSMCTEPTNCRNQEVEQNDAASSVTNSSGSARLLPSSTVSDDSDRTGSSANHASGIRSPRLVVSTANLTANRNGSPARIVLPVNLLPASMRPSAPVLPGIADPILCISCKGALVTNASFCAFCGTVVHDRDAIGSANSEHAAIVKHRLLAELGGGAR